MSRLNEIETRLAAIREECAAEGADIAKLTTETNTLITERTGLIAANEQRTALLNNIANNTTVTTPIATPPVTKPQEQRTFGIDSPEYRTGFFKQLRGMTLTDAEQRALAAADVPGTIPTQTQNQVEKKLVQIAPLIDQITLMHVPGNITFAVESTRGDATLHTENANVDASDDKTISVSLGGYEFVKLISISAKTAAMSVDAFETWIVDNLTESISYKIEHYLVNGTGNHEPQGVEYANTWVDDTNGIAWAGASLAVVDLTQTIGLLKAAYDRNAKFLMKKSTFWTNVYPLRDDGKSPIVSFANGKYYIFGYEAMFSDCVATGKIYLGDFKKIFGNFAQDFQFAASAISGFKNNATDYRGTCLFDSKVAVGEAFVKCAASL